nr:hypothetical protein [Tanacetum cinerariifolium]
MEWKLSEYESKLLENAQKKYFSFTLEYIKKYSLEQKYSVRLQYADYKTKQEVSAPFALTLFPAVDAGIPFKIFIPEILPISGVKYKASYGLSNELHIKQGHSKFIVPENSTAYFNANFPSKPQIIEGVFLAFRSDKKESKQLYRRLIIPVKDTDMTYPCSIIECQENYIKFDIEEWDRQSSLLGLVFLSIKGMFSILTIKGYAFHFYALESISSYVIDCVDKIAKEEFIRITSIIRLCMAFLCGKYYRGEIIYLSAEDSDFTKLINFDRIVESASALSENQLINPDFFFEYYEKQDAQSQAILKKHRKRFSANVFSSLCEVCIESPELRRTIELITRASSIEDPVQKGALYAVALEALTEHLVSETPEVFKPVSDKSEIKKLTSALMAALDASKNAITDVGYTILSKKIANINSPTNRDKLVKPFELYAIELLPEDYEALDKRNDYLHGREPVEGGTKYDLEQIALHLHTLISHLILKYAGYSGHLINLPSWNLLHNREAANKVNIDPEETLRVIQQIASESISTLEEVVNAESVLSKYGEFLKIEKLINSIIKIV